MTSRFRIANEGEIKKEFLSHVRLQYKIWKESGQRITASDARQLHGNSYEQVFLLDMYDDDALIEYIEKIMPYCGGKASSIELPLDYTDLLTRFLVPKLIERLKNEKCKILSDNGANNE